MNVPYLDLKVQYNALREELDEAMRQVISDTAFAGGPYVAVFEEEFSAYCQCSFAAGVSSGTNAIHLALLSLGIGPGDEVITAANTFIATAEAINHCGAVPVFADCDPETYTLDPAAAEAAITPRTKAIIPVHLFGQTADMDAFLELGRKYNLLILEDASQAHGAEYKGRRAGSMGIAGCFSLYPGKNLGAYGDAGIVVSNDEELIKKIKLIRDHGSVQKYEHAVIGWNARMDGLQGAVLSVKLRYLDEANRARRANARRYKELLADCPGILLPKEHEDCRHVFHIFAICSVRRDELMRHLTERGIGCGIHYPKPLHLQPAYAFMGKGENSYPVTEAGARQYLSLPMFPELTEEQIQYVVSAIKEKLGNVPATGRQREQPALAREL
jgi:dTDP-4-amino-4,6-dideoxygalactose transaminase